VYCVELHRWPSTPVTISFREWQETYGATSLVGAIQGKVEDALNYLHLTKNLYFLIDVMIKTSNIESGHNGSTFFNIIVYQSLPSLPMR
jgi:hypothetical protein